MATDADPTTLVKMLHLVFLSTFWGMQIWVTFISSELDFLYNPQWCTKFGSVAIFDRSEAFVGMNQAKWRTFDVVQLDEMLRPVVKPNRISGLREFSCVVRLTVEVPSLIICLFQITVFFICVTVAALNAYWFGQVTSDIMAEMHLIEQSYGLGGDVGLFLNKSLIRLRQLDSNYNELACKLSIYHGFSSLCNLCCIACNGLSLYYMAAHLSAL
ncbi:hypothetical protein JD844_017937 [Phrynosoma platyrhinos]|uniref:Uncharacterized protein n=1 Tax=Phrynosoma platyrhinos TaxID=52577 RepID=A0ABQ7SMJ5_PHRPL|nr:hypothetical protein JD844_017937 [Phrynosoma platyrhinos]